MPAKKTKGLLYWVFSLLSPIVHKNTQARKLLIKTIIWWPETLVDFSSENKTLLPVDFLSGSRHLVRAVTVLSCLLEILIITRHYQERHALSQITNKRHGITIDRISLWHHFCKVSFAVISRKEWCPYQI